MANSVTDRNLVYETVSASGTVYLTLDSQLVYWHTFQHHLNFNVVYDKVVPLLTNSKSHGFTLVSNEQMNYDRTHPTNSFNQNNFASDVDYNNSKRESDIDCVDDAEQVSIDNGNVCVSFETASCLQDQVAEDSGGSSSLTSPLRSRDTIGIELFVGKCENVGETVSEDKTIDSSQIIHFRKNNLKENKRTSERLLNNVLKNNKNFTPKVCLNQKSEIQRCKRKMLKVREDKDQTKQINTKSVVKPSIALLQNKSQSAIKKYRSHETSRKPKEKIGEIDEKSRAAKVRKLDLKRDIKCEYCLETFQSQQEYFDHRKGERTSFKCKICGKTVPFKAHLIVHMLKHNNYLQEEHPTLEQAGNRSENNLEPNVSNGSDYSKSDKQIKCDLCGLIVSNIPILKTHTMMHTGEYAYKCCLCGDKTHSIAKYNNHLSTHIKSGKVQCKICNISFESRSDLSRHQLTHEFKCSICDKVFPNKTSRVFHYKMVHKDEILKCTVCGKMFSSQDELEPHLKYHRNRAKTQCTICGLFVTRLDNHILSHNQRTEDSKMYVCDQCPKQFKQKLSFQRHMRTHSEEKPYACIECSKRFARSGGLRRHMITHTQERPFICNICGKACSQMGNLRIHMQIHKDISPVQCKVCGEPFSHKHNLQEHMKITHYVDLSVSNPPAATPTVLPGCYS